MRRGGCGGSGACAIELCRHYPELSATVFDLPHVCAIAERSIDAAGLTNRISTSPGDFRRNAALPARHDVVLLSLVLHDWPEQQNRAILRLCHDALDADGLIVISELLVDDDKTGPAPAALMSLNMLIETEGRNYTAAEYITWLRDTGFAEPQVIRFDGPGANGAVVARKPGT